MADKINYNTNKSLTTQQQEEIKQSSIGVKETDSLIIPKIISKNLDRTFGRPDDFIEMHIYNKDNTLLQSDYNFTEYEVPTNNAHAPYTNHITINPHKVLYKLGYLTGQYKLKFNVLKNKVYNTEDYPFLLTQVSNNKRELRCIGDNIPNKQLDRNINNFISDLESSVYFKEFSLNFGRDNMVPCINIMLNKTPDKHEFYVKTLSPLRDNKLTVRSKFKIVEEIASPFTMNVDLGTPIIQETGINLSGPNFQVDIKQNSSIPSGFKTYDELLNYEVTSSYQQLLSRLEDDGLNLDIDYTYIKPVSGAYSTERNYHFEGFTHFGRATERLKNFNYKLELIENYDSQLNDIYNITGDTSSSFAVVEDKNNISDKRQDIIKNFDGYEQFLYFTSGSDYTWPKYTNTKPYQLYSISSSEAKTWLGHENSSFNYYGGQLLSASLFDRQNPYNLNKAIPNHIKDDDNNNLYVTFVDMVGQHFDHIWTYIKEISEIYNTHNYRGISKNLVYHQLKSFGIDTFDQFENSDLIGYILGGGGSGSQDFYNVNHFYNYADGHPSSSLGLDLAVSSSETLVTASNSPSIPKESITKEIWKRLYHNAPYLLKTKGTERGLRALMSCYGVPSTILNVKEYGGSTTATGHLKDIDMSEYYKTFTYEKASLAYSGVAGGASNNYMYAIQWSASAATHPEFAGDPHPFTEYQEEHKTVEFRVKPLREEGSNYHLFSLTGSWDNTTGAPYPTADNHLILDNYTGNDISSSGDYTQYGRLQYYIGNDLELSTNYFPIYDGDFWNIFIQANKASMGRTTVKFGAYKANFNKNIHKYIKEGSNLGSGNSYVYCWGARSTTSLGGNGAKYAYFGGLPAHDNAEYDPVDQLKFSGSLQEIRFHWGELLTDNTLKKHALEPFMYSGNTISSSWENLVYRAPLGSNDLELYEEATPQNKRYLGSPGRNPISERWEEVVEYHYLPTPDTVGISTTSEKVRIDEGTVDENILSPYVKGETSTLDRQPQDFEDLGVFFSPVEEINEDILYTLGSFRMDDYIGSPLPSAQTSSKYEDLKNIKDLYYRKVDRRFNYWDYIKLIQGVDHTLFKIIENFVPARANLKTGLVIEPSFLERNKIARTLPIRSDAQTMITGSHQTLEITLKSQMYNIRSSSAQDFGQVGLNNNIIGQHDPGSYVAYHSNPSPISSSKGHRQDLGTNTTIAVYDDYMDPSRRDSNEENNMDCQAPITPFDSTTGKPTGYIAHKSSVFLGNAISGRKSNRYYTYPEYRLYSSSTSNQYLIPGDD